MTLIEVRVGDNNPTTAMIAADVTSASNVRIAVGVKNIPVDVTYHGPVTPTANSNYDPVTPFNVWTAKVQLTGLTPGVRHYYWVEHAGVLDTVKRGEFLTPAVNPDSITLGTIGDAGLTPTTPGVGTVLAAHRMSNDSAFRTVIDRAIAENWVSLWNLGDWYYCDPGRSVPHGSIPVGAAGYALAVHHRLFTDLGRQPLQAEAMRRIANIMLPDDHERGPDNHDGTFPGGANFETMYRSRLPHRTLTDPGGVWQAQEFGDLAIVVGSDVRHARSPNDDPDVPGKTMLGADQLAWLYTLLANSRARCLIWMMPDEWIRLSGNDSWPEYSTERQAIADRLDAMGWAGRTVMVNADRHAVKLASGSGNPWGGWPVMVASPMDADGGEPLSDYPDGLPDDPGASRAQYGTVTITKSPFGDVTVTARAWREMTLLGEESITLAAPPVVVDRARVARVVAGSHAVAYEARVLTTYQDGDDPDGEDIPILTGTVSLDSTADIYGSLAMDTLGAWPQRETSALAPYGNEIFARAGISTGADTLWTPLGYYRIQTPNQPTAADGPIGITGFDRMAGIIDARFLAPRQYTADRTVGEVVADLVTEIYPAATIVWDDDTQNEPLGRAIGSEDSRYDLLREVVESWGKSMWWDVSGRLRIETPPETARPLWHIHAGPGGAMASPSRSVTRDGIYNAVVVTGEGTAGDEDPVRAVAIDDNVNSPTYFYGRFGQVPRYYSSPLITTYAQALAVAKAMLGRAQGYPYSVTFAALPNPWIRPLDPTQLRYNDGTFEDHVLEQVTIPLSAQDVMSTRTRLRTTSVIGDLA